MARKTGQQAVDLALEELEGKLRQLALDVRGALLEVDLPDATVVNIAHGLGYPWTGYQVIRMRGATTAGFINEQGAVAAYDTTKLLRLRADDYGATINVVLWVF